jgi:four helix bundle protein
MINYKLKLIMKENTIKLKTALFATKIVGFTRDLRNLKIEVAMVNQLLRSGTSIGANVEEACAGISRKEFSMKLSISYKEAKETLYWLKLLKETNSISSVDFTSLSNDCDEILRILWAILKKTRMSNKE